MAAIFTARTRTMAWAVSCAASAGDSEDGDIGAQDWVRRFALARERCVLRLEVCAWGVAIMPDKLNLSREHEWHVHDTCAAISG